MEQTMIDGGKLWWQQPAPWLCDGTLRDWILWVKEHIFLKGKFLSLERDSWTTQTVALTHNRQFSSFCDIADMFLPNFSFPEEGQAARAHAEDAQPRKGGQEGWSDQPLQNLQAPDRIHWLWELHVQVSPLHDGLPPQGHVGECLSAVTASLLYSDE